MTDQLKIDIQCLIEQLNRLRSDNVERSISEKDAEQGLYLLGQAIAYENTRVILTDILKNTQNKRHA